MSKTKSTVVVNHRNAVNGQFVKPSYVKSNPATTTTERNRVPAPTKSSK